MRHAGDKRTSKLAFLAIAFVFIYLAFFRFDLAAAYAYTVTGARSMLSIFGI